MIKYKDNQKELLEALFKTDSNYKHYEESLWNKEHNVEQFRDPIWQFYPSDEDIESGKMSDEFAELCNSWMFNIRNFWNPEYNKGSDWYDIETVMKCDEQTACCLYDRDWNPLKFNIHIDSDDEVGKCSVHGCLDSIDDAYYDWWLDDIPVERAIEIVREQIYEIEIFKKFGTELNGSKWQESCVERYGARVD